MEDFYKPLARRKPDSQYKNVLRFVLEQGELVKDTPQGNGAWTCFGNAPDMVFDLSNGIPMITERKIGAKMPIAEILAFIHGERIIDKIEEWGCPFWNDYKGKGTELGLDPNDLGPGSYGAAFAAYPKPDGTTLDQFKQLVEQIRHYPTVRTLRVTSWVPFYTARGPDRKVIVAPCHGDTYWRVMNNRLHMTMVQRSADLPIGVPHNMVQYAAMHLMMCRATGYEPGLYVHKFVDAHIYESQVGHVHEILTRAARPFPILQLDPKVKDFFDFRPEHFTVEEYNPQPAIKGIPYFP